MPSSLFTAIDDLPPITYTSEMAQLLSASSYPHAPAATSSHHRKRPSDLMYGGIVATHESTDEEDEDEDVADIRSTKKSKPQSVNRPVNNETSQDVPKRQRGRPKVSTKDETAAERRRTQIRLAQRAYRNRKENTIAELTQKVDALQGTIKSLNVGLLRLRETLLDTGMMHDNSTITRQMDELMRQISDALESPPSDGDTGEESEAQGHVFLHDAAQYDMMGPHMVPMPTQGQRNPATSIAAANPSRNMLKTSPVSRTTYPTSSVSKTKERPSQDPIVTTISNEHPASVSIERFPIKPTYTYSFQETTLSRRLHRLCIERAFQRLMSPHVSREWELRTFRFTFNFSTKERILKTFKSVLSRGTDEALENWRTPFIHIGGAGLHFPRRNDHGQPVYPPNLLAPGHAASTWRLPTTETIPQGNTLEEVLESVGFGGEWFDCHDVEEYLKTKGIYLEPQSSFVTVDRELIQTSPSIGSDVTDMFTSSSGSSPISDGSKNMMQTPISPVMHSTMKELNQSLSQSEMPTLADNPIDTWLGQQEVHFPNDFDIELEQPLVEITHQKSNLVTIEVEKFLERLSDQSACLGRAPGFRKEHVDLALSLALQEAF